VVAGSKTFVMLPPSDVFRMRLRKYPLATYAPQAGTAGRLAAVLHGLGEEVLWSSVQPEDCWDCENSRGSLGADAESTVATPSQPNGRTKPPGASCGNTCREAGAARQRRSCCCTKGGGIECGGMLEQPGERQGGASGEPGGSGGDDGGDCGCSGGSSGNDGSGSGCSRLSGPPTQAPPSEPTTTSSGCWAGDLFASPDLPRPIRVTVRPGELLYLPAMWWHQVCAALQGPCQGCQPLHAVQPCAQAVRHLPGRCCCCTMLAARFTFVLA
jgi:hypothetical protein